MTKNVAIIGGSAAGLFTAKMLAEQGLNVKVFEAAEHIDPSPRSLIVTGHLPKVTGPMYQSALVNKIHRFELYADGRVAEISLKQPDLVIERSKLLNELEAQAKASGENLYRSTFFKPEAEWKAFGFQYYRKWT